MARSSSSTHLVHIDDVTSNENNFVRAKALSDPTVQHLFQFIDQGAIKFPVNNFKRLSLSNQNEDHRTIANTNSLLETLQPGWKWKTSSNDKLVNESRTLENYESPTTRNYSDRLKIVDSSAKNNKNILKKAVPFEWCPTCEAITTHFCTSSTNRGEQHCVLEINSRDIFAKEFDDYRSHRNDDKSNSPLPNNFSTVSEGSEIDEAYLAIQQLDNVINEYASKSTSAFEQHFDEFFDYFKNSAGGIDVEVSDQNSACKNLHDNEESSDWMDGFGLVKRQAKGCMSHKKKHMRLIRLNGPNQLSRTSDLAAEDLNMTQFNDDSSNLLGKQVAPVNLMFESPPATAANIQINISCLEDFSSNSCTLPSAFNDSSNWPKTRRYSRPAGVLLRRKNDVNGDQLHTTVFPSLSSSTESPNNSIAADTAVYRNHFDSAARHGIDRGDFRAHRSLDEKLIASNVNATLQKMCGDTETIESSVVRPGINQKFVPDGYNCSARATSNRTSIILEDNVSTVQVRNTNNSADRCEWLIRQRDDEKFLEGKGAYPINRRRLSQSKQLQNLPAETSTDERSQTNLSPRSSFLHNGFNKHDNSNTKTFPGYEVSNRIEEDRNRNEQNLRRLSVPLFSLISYKCAIGKNGRENFKFTKHNTSNTNDNSNFCGDSKKCSPLKHVRKSEGDTILSAASTSLAKGSMCSKVGFVPSVGAEIEGDEFDNRSISAKKSCHEPSGTQSKILRRVIKSKHQNISNCHELNERSANSGSVCDHTSAISTVSETIRSTGKLRTAANNDSQRSISGENGCKVAAIQKNATALRIPVPVPRKFKMTVAEDQSNSDDNYSIHL